MPEIKIVVIKTIDLYLSDEDLGGCPPQCCGCRYLSGYNVEDSGERLPFCDLFKSSLNCFDRLEACLEAEKKAKGMKG